MSQELNTFKKMNQDRLEALKDILITNKYKTMDVQAAFMLCRK